METHGFFWKKSNDWQKGSLRVKKAQTLDSYSINFNQCDVRTESGGRPKPGIPMMVNICHESLPFTTEGPAMVQPEKHGHVYVTVVNSHFTLTEISRNDNLVFTENLEDCQLWEIDSSFVASVADEESRKRMTKNPLTPEKESYICKAANLEHMPEKLRLMYLSLLLKHHAAVSQNKMDLGRTKTLMNNIELRDLEPVYIKQFKIPDAHQKVVEQKVAEWLKLGVVQPCQSKFNSPLFCVMKKNASLRSGVHW